MELKKLKKKQEILQLNCRKVPISPNKSIKRQIFAIDKSIFNLKTYLKKLGLKQHCKLRLKKS